MHEKLTDILETKWLEKIENSLSAHGIETRMEKDGDRKWFFTCTCDETRAEKARHIFEKEGAECVSTEKGVDCTVCMPKPVFCTYAPEDEEEIRNEKISAARSAVEALPNAVYEDTEDGLIIAVLPPYVPSKAGNITKYRDYQHRTAETLAAGYDLSDVFKYMLIDSPTGSGKSTILTLLYLILKEKDPELKMIVSTTQHSLVRNILDSFQSMDGVKAVTFKGIEKLVEGFFDDKDGGLETRYQGVTQEGLDLLDEMFKIKKLKALMDIKKSEALEQDLKDKQAEYRQLIRDIRDKWSFIHSRWGRTDSADEEYETPSFGQKDADKAEKEEKLSALTRLYKQAEQLLNSVCWDVSGEQAEDHCKVLEEKGSLPEKKELDAFKKEIRRRFYTEKMQQINDRYRTLLVLFPDLQYELSDVIIVTHAKSVRGILNKRSLDLANTSREGEARHIVFVVDEMEAWRDEYEKKSIQEAVKNSVDMLSFVNTIHSCVEKGYFSNKKYEIVSGDGKHENKAQKNAEKLKDLMKEVFGAFNYEPRMHLADYPNEEKRSLPRITSCGTYLIQNVPKNLDVRTDPETMEVFVIKPSQTSAEKTKEGSGEEGKDGASKKDCKNTGFVAFVRKMDGIIQMFVGTVREAVNGLHQLHNLGIQSEDFESTLGTVLHQLAIEPGVGGRAGFIRRNMFPRHGVRWVSQDTPHPYRLGISHTILRPRLPSGRDVYLYFFKIDRFADAAMADITYNVKFTYLMSGTGWLAGQNNLDDRFLDAETGRFLPDRSVTEEIHDGYMAWKSTQYQGTEFIVDRVSGRDFSAASKDAKNKQDRFHSERLSTCAEFIARHMSHMKEKGIDGGTGGLIFPSWTLKENDINTIRTEVRQHGADPDNVILLSLEKGKVYEWVSDGERLKHRLYDGTELVDDTQVVKTVKGKFTYVLTAYRSGTRGYNIAFAKEGEDRLYDASGIWLTAVTNILPGVDKQETDAPRQETVFDFQKKMATALEIHAKSVHAMNLREGTINPQAMKGVEGRIKQILTGEDVPKDIYREDIWSPYKLQGTSEILQALGRLRNNKKEPVIYIALDSIIFGKTFLREEHLDPDRLSYEAAQVYDRLPDLWRGYEAETREGTFTAWEIEKNIIEKSERIIRGDIPRYKKQLAGRLTEPERVEALHCLERRVRDYEFTKKRSLYMNTVLFPYPYREHGESSRNLGIPSIWLSRLKGKDLSPFTYYSRRTADGTEFSTARIPGQAYITPSTGDIVPVIRMFSHFCRDELKKGMPELMNSETLQLMEQKDMFPYPVFANPYGYDLFIGEFGEQIFDAVMDHARRAGTTELTVSPMPILQYEDYDKVIYNGEVLKGYVNVKYRIDSDFEVEKDPKFYIDKAMRIPVKGEIPLLYIDIRPFGDTVVDKVFAESEEEGILSDTVREANKVLRKAGKSIAVIVMKPLTRKDMSASSDRIKEVINERIIQRINKYFGG